MKINIATAPSVEPITTAEAKTHLRVTHSNDDDYIDTLIEAAREYVESFTGRAIIQQTIEYYLDKFPANDGPIELPRPELRSITSFSYTDTAQSETALVAGTDYSLDSVPPFGRLFPEYGKHWPTIALYPVNPIKITYVAGYADDGSSPADYRANVPKGIKHAIKLLVAELYDQRAITVTGLVNQAVKFSVDNLLSFYRVRFLA